MNPIFIIGTERSGTNLLRLILNAHSRIFIPHPPHILKNLFKLEPFYSDLNNDFNFRRLIDDVVMMIKLHPFKWEVIVDKDRIFKTVKERNLINIFFNVYDQYLETANKKRWGCKSTFMINHVALIRQYYPDSKFIYIVRDGREVANSAKKTIFNHYTVYYSARLWKNEQQTGIYWLNKLSSESIYLVRYEDLLRDSKKTIKSICSFLDESYEEEMLNYFETEEAKKSAGICAAWINTSKPIMKDNCGKFKTELSIKEITLFENIAAPELDWFGYKLSQPFYKIEGARARGIKFKVSYFLEEYFLMLYVQIKYFSGNKNNPLWPTYCYLRYKKFWFLKIIRLKAYLKI